MFARIVVVLARSRGMKRARETLVLVRGALAKMLVLVRFPHAALPRSLAWLLHFAHFRSSAPSLSCILFWSPKPNGMYKYIIAIIRLFYRWIMTWHLSATRALYMLCLKFTGFIWQSVRLTENPCTTTSTYKHSWQTSARFRSLSLAFARNASLPEIPVIFYHFYPSSLWLFGRAFIQPGPGFEFVANVFLLRLFSV